jgi:SpoIIAA-like
MSAEIVNDQGDTLVFKITGTLAQSEFTAAQKDATEILQKSGTKHMLVLAEHFEGWGKGNWGDLSGQIEMEPYIDKMAIVGEEKWKSLALLFAGKGIRRMPIEFFAPADLAKAQAWLHRA